jgi:roadblock/LC7 domain-containing protein
MGFFKSVRELNKQGKEISRNWDVGAQLADAQSSMAAANQMMAQQTAAANIAATGLDATATVAAVRQGGALVNYQPMVEIDLTVMAPGSPPYAATVSQVVQQVHLARLRPGASLRVKVDPANPATIWIDFFAA